MIPDDIARNDKVRRKQKRSQHGMKSFFSTDAHVKELVQIHRDYISMLFLKMSPCLLLGINEKQRIT